MAIQRCMQLPPPTFWGQQLRRQREVQGLWQNCQQTRTLAPSTCRRRRTLTNGRCRRGRGRRRWVAGTGTESGKIDLQMAGLVHNRISFVDSFSVIESCLYLNGNVCSEQIMLFKRQMLFSNYCILWNAIHFHLNSLPTLNLFNVDICI